MNSCHAAAAARGETVTSSADAEKSRSASEGDPVVSAFGTLPRGCDTTATPANGPTALHLRSSGTRCAWWPLEAEASLDGPVVNVDVACLEVAD